MQEHIYGAAAYGDGEASVGIMYAKIGPIGEK
jgi:hypothetical protein